jgi:hypothetical protein
MSHTEYSAQFVQYSSVFLGLEEAPKVCIPKILTHVDSLVAPHFSTGWKTLFLQLAEVAIIQERVFQWESP